MLNEKLRNEIMRFCKEMDLDYFKVVVFIEEQIKFRQLLIRRSFSSNEVRTLVKNTKTYLLSNRI
ncbi:hypothetical protein LCGC14_2217100 [marine sediment metagenome]|uniref:Uncharacterized protein n=1 Tax=marine sediment metagenome TaxID=412755 RepID=A0A0F9G7R9_9ZZZZ